MIRPRIITIDCETLPAHTAKPTDEEAVSHANLSDLNRQCSAPATDDTATDALPDTRDHQRRALNGDTGRLLCIGFIDEGGGRQPVKGVLGWNRERGCFTDDEVEILRDFWELMRTFRPCVDRIVVHNLYNFDLP